MDSEPRRTRDEVSREVQDMQECQPFPMGSIDNSVGENRQSRESQLLALVQNIIIA